MSEPKSTAVDNSGVLAWFVRNHIAANLLMVLLLAGGIYAALSTTVTVFPDIDPGIVTVSVPYPGSTPSEVEESINRRIEEAITGIEGIDRIRSVASEGVGTVTAELDEYADDREVLDDIKSAVEQIQNFPPEDAEDPRIADTSVVNPVISLAIYGDASERSLREFAFRIRDELTGLDGISIADVNGVRDYEIGVEISERALRERGLSFQQVSAAVRNFSINLPGGTIRAEDGEVLLRTDGQAYEQEDFENIVLTTHPDGTLVLLGDVATINDGFASDQQITLFNGERAAFVDISRVGNQQALDIEEMVKDYVQQIALPRGIEITTWSNRADLLRSRVDLLARNGLMGLVLVFACLLLFLDLRLAFWTTMGIAISFVGAFLVIYASGISINMISLFAFILVLGIVVDDAIIVGESIYTKREQGLQSTDAAIAGLRDVVVPVSMGITTTIFAFVPLLFTSGFFGQILGVIPIVVISVLFMSLLEAVFILPSHLSASYEVNKQSTLSRAQQYFRSRLDLLIYRVYTPVLKYCIRQPYVVVASVICMLMLTFGVINGGKIKFVLLPTIDSDEISLELEMPNGTAVAETERYIRHILDAAEQTRTEFDNNSPEGTPSAFRNISATIGSAQQGAGGPGGQGGSSGGSHIGQVRIELLQGELRNFESLEVETLWRELIGPIPSANLTFTSSLLTAGDDISVELTHADFDQLLVAAEQVKQHVNGYQGVEDIQDSFDLGKRELRMELTDAGIASGLTLNDLARQVRQAFYGDEAQRIQRGRDEITVLVRYSEAERNRIASIYDMRVRLQSGEEVPFRTVARVEEGRGYSTIERTDRKRVVGISAKVDENSGNAAEINRILESEILPAMALDMPGLAYSFEGADRERVESFGSLGSALIFVLVAVFGILAVQLRSYSQPIIIMSVIPLGFVGAVIGHMTLGYDMSIMSMFGLVALAGVVVNDSLILMDMINRLRREGMEVKEAIISAGQRRFRPIFFTTLTTCAGLMPMISEESLQAQFLIPMAISLSFGVAFATLITLIIVPSLYTIRSNIGACLRARRQALIDESKAIEA